jgi:predicted metalloprotease
MKITNTHTVTPSDDPDAMKITIDDIELLINPRTRVVTITGDCTVTSSAGENNTLELVVRPDRKLDLLDFFLASTTYGGLRDLGIDPRFIPYENNILKHRP